MHTKFEALVNELSRTAKQKISAGQQILSAGIFSTLLASVIPRKIQPQGGKKPKCRILIGSILQFFATNSTRVANGSYYIGCWISIKPGRRRAGSGPRQIRVPATRHGKMIPYSRIAWVPFRSSFSIRETRVSCLSRHIRFALPILGTTRSAQELPLLRRGGHGFHPYRIEIKQEVNSSI